MVGYLVRSLAGHDAGQIYLVIREESGTVYLADGTYKTFRNPKRKNKKHVEILSRMQDTAKYEQLLAGETFDKGYIIWEVKNV